MILKAKHNVFIYPFFQFYTRWKLRRTFHEIHFCGNFTDEKLPVLIIANHISWWDGFWLMYLNLKKINRKFHFMMLEEQLRKHWYFNYAGAYSVNKKSRSVLQTIRYTSDLLKSSSNMVFMFPQGKIKSMHESKLTFEAGIEKILHHIPNDIQVLFVANFIEYLSQPKPSLFIHLETYSTFNKDHESVQTAYNSFYAKALDYHKNLSE